MSPIDEERLNVAHAAADRLLRGLKTLKPLQGRALRRMKLVESAVQYLELARLA
jgi:hypothetical protein